MKPNFKAIVEMARLEGKRGQANMNELLISFLVLIVGLAFTPTVVTQVATVSADGNASATVKALLALVPVGWVLAILGIAITLAVRSTK